MVGLGLSACWVGGYFERGTGGETAVMLPSPGGCKHLTGDGSESTWLRHGKPVFSMQTSTPPPFNACNSQPRLGEESGGEIFPMLTVVGNWRSASQEPGGPWRCLPTTSLPRHLDLHLLFVVIENCRFNPIPLSTGD
ncbi:unnamed protein product [Rangifer tarandus platyrhynchus]|uniref:Uncharacterized protein n=2 Tax=Rangifer tarandus platyrhynchus TaxID=3082113 RepID=A0ACB0FHD0_RANTA|nr:unnamed protein product [Rangifer tarandus platyrhynchus]CAI9712168.1 unnamed protein product [Rangifer tarandus platyrhynchus]